MPEPEYTPGPWRASWSREGQSWSILNEDGHMIANAFESEANARRIAAAPDMEEALEALIDHCEREFAGGCDICAIGHAAIAKAKGGRNV